MRWASVFSFFIVLFHATFASAAPFACPDTELQDARNLSQNGRHGEALMLMVRAREKTGDVFLYRGNCREHYDFQVWLAQQTISHQGASTKRLAPDDTSTINPSSRETARLSKKEENKKLSQPVRPAGRNFKSEDELIQGQTEFPVVPVLIGLFFFAAIVGLSKQYSDRSGKVDTHVWYK